MSIDPHEKKILKQKKHIEKEFQQIAGIIRLGFDLTDLFVDLLHQRTRRPATKKRDNSRFEEAEEIK